MEVFLYISIACLAFTITDAGKLKIDSSSSYELFVVSIMQEDVSIGYPALALTLGFQVFSYTEATTTGRLLGPTTSQPHKDGSIPLSALPKDTTNELAGLFSTLFLFAERQAVNTIF